MKKLLLTIVLFFVLSFANAQKLTPKFLEGKWETEFHNVEFKGTNKKDFIINVTLKETGETVDVVKHAFDNNVLYIETNYKATDFTAIGKLIVMDENTLVEDVYSDYPGILIYKRKLN